MKYKVDNIKNYKKTNNWIMGCFMPKNSILFSNEVEVKIDNLDKIDSETVKPHYHPKGKNMAIITKGKVKWVIDGKEHITKTGDFIIMENKMTEAIIKVYEPSTIITVRTPSIPNNKVYVN